MKLFKGIFVGSLLILSVIFVSIPSNADGYDEFYALAQGYGFNISKEYKPKFLRETNSGGAYDDQTFIRKETIINGIKDKTENVTTVIDMLLYNVKNPRVHCYAYKVISEPKQPGRNWGFMGIGSYGDDFLQDYVKVTIDFPKEYEILSYTPTNSPSQWTTSIGVGLSGSGFDISASVSFDHSELNVISRTSTYDRYYEAVYDFDYNYKVNGKHTEYMKHEVTSFGMIMFQTGMPDFVVHYDIHYHSINGYEQSLSSAKFLNFVNEAV